MRIVNLVENTTGTSGCACAHGLCFYIETKRHKLLLDAGPDGTALENAALLGIDVGQADTLILSHGHYDHAGGILPFAARNAGAAIYIQQTADGAYYADDGEEAGDARYRYIGIDTRIAALPQTRRLQGDTVIDEELELFTIRAGTHELPFANKHLLIRRDDGFVRDRFAHEQFLVLKDGDMRVLLSGCAHNGVLQIMDAYREKYGSCPDAVISGFHLMVKRDHTRAEREEIRRIAAELTKYPAVFYTCHCTGIAAYEEMKALMGEQLRYVHAGDEIIL